MTIPLPTACGEWSLPSRGAWIEMCRPVRLAPAVLSLPSRGAWIEILADRPCKECQLVAPLTGSVEGGIILSKWCFNYAPSEYEDIDRDGFSYTRSAYVNLCRRKEEDGQPLDSLRGTTDPNPRNSGKIKHRRPPSGARLPGGRFSLSAAEAVVKTNTG